MSEMELDPKIKLQPKTNESRQLEVESRLPEAIREVAVGLGSRQLDHFHRNIVLADAKTTAIIAGAVALGTFVYNTPSKNSTSMLLGAVVLILLGISLLFGAMAIVPRTPGGKSGVIFWNDVRLYRNGREYYDAIRELSTAQLERAYAEQAWLVADVVHKKYDWLRASMIAFFLAAILLLICGLANR
jgi:hypothetical protein